MMSEMVVFFFLRGCCEPARLDFEMFMASFEINVISRLTDELTNRINDKLTV